jgi:acyl-CoA thioester hydrolase
MSEGSETGGIAAGAAGPWPAPEGAVAPESIDYNGHMNVTWYTKAFDLAIDAFLDDALGVGPAYVARSGFGPYALQAHIHYLGELRLGERFRVAIRLVDADTKRLHLFCEMTNAATGAPAATLEQVTMNVDLRTRRAAPYPDPEQARIAALRAAHAGLPRPPRLGAPIGLRRGGTA